MAAHHFLNRADTIDGVAILSGANPSSYSASVLKRVLKLINHK